MSATVRLRGSERAGRRRHGGRESSGELLKSCGCHGWQRRNAGVACPATDHIVVFIASVADDRRPLPVVGRGPDLSRINDPRVIPDPWAWRTADNDVGSSRSDPLTKVLQVIRSPFGRLRLLIRIANRMPTAPRLSVPETAQFESLSSSGSVGATRDTLLSGHMGMRFKGGTATRGGSMAKRVPELLS